MSARVPAASVDSNRPHSPAASQGARARARARVSCHMQIGTPGGRVAAEPRVARLHVGVRDPLLQVVEEQLWESTALTADGEEHWLGNPAPFCKPGEVRDRGLGLGERSGVPQLADLFPHSLSI